MDHSYRHVYSTRDCHTFAPYTVTHISVMDRAELYSSKKAQLNKCVSQIKVLNTLETKIMSLTPDARHVMFGLVKKFIKNELINMPDDKELTSMKEFFNQYNKFDNVWYVLYKEHSDNSMIQKIVDFLGL